MNIKCRITLQASLLTLLVFSTVKVFATTDTWVTNGDGTVTDVATGLIWQQQDDAIGRTHVQALIYCQNLDLAGASDWRLPNVKELASIVDFRRNNPAINSADFPNTSQSYWSSTSVASNPGDAWIVFFLNGTAQTLSKDTGFVFSRCMR